MKGGVVWQRLFWRKHMKKKLITTILVLVMTVCMVAGCGSVENVVDRTEETAKSAEAAECYEKGRAALFGMNGNKFNLEEAYNDFVKAKELGYADANFYLGVLCDWYNYPKNDYEAAKVYYEACGENPYAQMAIAFLYMSGMGVEKDEAKAQEMFQTVINQGCVEGYLGNGFFAEAKGDYAAALEDFNKVLEGTEQLYIRIAMNEIGFIYDMGEGVEQDYSKAMEWYEKAADLGHYVAMQNIGDMFFKGKGVEKNYAKAFEWYEKSAELGDSTAMVWLGYMYYKGQGVEQNYAKTIEWLEKAAELDDTTAMFLMGYIYYTGEGVGQDYAKALEWYEKAAELGDEDARERADEIREILQK